MQVKRLLGRIGVNKLVLHFMLRSRLRFDNFHVINVVPAPMSGNLYRIFTFIKQHFPRKDIRKAFKGGKPYIAKGLSVKC
ncbi:hypothetical protein D3C78_1808340 [compost metagenome]